jgi:MSHA pilin protein MshC
MRRLDRRSRLFGSGERGFTLFEIIMVLLILGVLSYFVATRLFSGDALTQNGEMELVKNHLRYAQSRAMNTEPLAGSTNVWGIKLGSSTRYWLYREPSDTTIVRLPGVESSDGAVVLNTIQISWNSPATEKVAFDSFGSPGSSTLSYTVQPKGGGSALGTITVTKNTGFIP